MRTRALLVALPLLLLAACGEDDGGVAETEETTTSTTEDASPETTIEAGDPADDAVQGREACNDIPSGNEGADAEALQAIADEAPADVAGALEELIAAGEGGDPSSLGEAEDGLAEVCGRYGVDLERAGEAD